MTVETTVSRAQYNTNGTNGPWTVPFYFIENGDLSVIYSDADGNETELTLDIGYTVTGAGNPTGTVTTTEAYAPGGSITLLRNVYPLQTYDFRDGDDFPAEVVETGLDRLTQLAQQTLEVVGRALVFAPSDTEGSRLPAAAARANLLLGFDSDGRVSMVAPIDGSASALALDLASTASATKGAGMVAFSYARNYVAGTIGSVPRGVGIDVTQPPFNCDPTGAADCSAGIQLALTSYPGIPLLFPKGTYRCDSTININGAPTWGVFGLGAIIRGAGVGSTFFDNRVANGPLFNVDSDSHGGTYHANMGTVFEHFVIMTTTSPAASTGIRVLNAWQVTIQNVAIKGMTQDGIELMNGAYTDDGWNRVAIIQTWLDSCARWGIKADGTSGRNEGSYTYLRNVFFQGCGTSSASATPPSGGMIWKGQVLTIESSAAANGNQNVALFIKGDSGLGNTVDIRGFTSENTYKRGIYCTGVTLFKGRNIQVYNNDDHLGTVGVEFDGSAYTVRNVEIDGAVIRATAGNTPYTAFKISGANADLKSCRVRNVAWENFVTAGQTRMDGWQFDQIRQDCDVVAVSATQVTFKPNSAMGRGNVSPLRLRGGGGAPSTTGEWVQTVVPAGGYSTTNSGLSANTRYYAYFYDNAGAPAIELSTTVATIDTATGYPVKTGDATRLYIGSVATDGSSQFLLTGCGWLNPLLVPGSQPGVYNRMWTDSLGKLRIKYASDPTSDTDGTIVGTQT